MRHLPHKPEDLSSMSRIHEKLEGTTNPTDYLAEETGAVMVWDHNLTKPT